MRGRRRQGEAGRKGSLTKSLRLDLFKKED